jgi:SHO1 osmosensor
MGRISALNILGDPWALATISVSILSWLVSFVSSIVANIQTDFPNYVWWAIAYMLICILGIITVMASNMRLIYSMAIIGYLPAGLIFSILAANSLVYQPEVSKQLAAAGFIILSKVTIIWIFHFGSTTRAPYRRVDFAGSRRLREIRLNQ